ncbi:hypothetical protein [Chryseobacterium sp.]|uniref:hypothetical protein n=1 Tax=Chryseobacterium sp. TaxID=1871047 RepID=UPI00289A8792|nr:hypothetical protein [Chryseobacterium sp.]
MTKYVALHKHSDKKFHITFDSFGVLNSILLEGERWTEEQVNWIFKSSRVPKTEVTCMQFAENRDLDFDYMEIPKDLSFEYFWNTFAYKKGKISVAQKAWKALSASEKIEALLYIPKLKMQKQIDKTAMPYPATYLNGKYWLADKI